MPVQTSYSAPTRTVETLSRPETPPPPVNAPLCGPNLDGAVQIGRQLHAAGNLEPAIDVYRRVLASRPEHPAALHLMGIALHQLGDLPAALDALEAAVAANPADAGAWSDLGETYRNLQRFDEALDALDAALELDVANHAACCNRGHALLQAGRPAEAVEAYERTVELGFEDTHLRTAEGVALKQLHRLDAAARTFERALELDPSNPEPRFLRAVVRGDALDHVPSAYVRSLFDRYAPGFETHLVKLLEYRGHEALLTALSALDLPDTPAWHVADLGCGTGLCGALFKPYAATLTGVDLSQAMIAEAWTRGIYDELVHADLTAALDGRRIYDLVLAGDVFIYVGDLERVMVAGAGVIRPGGYFAFTTECLDEGQGYRLRTSGRFAHAERYVRELADRHGFTITSIDDVTIRTEQGQPIAGQVVVLRRA